MKRYIFYTFAVIAAIFAAAVTSCEPDSGEAKEYSIYVTIGDGGSVETTVEGKAASKAMEGESVTLTAMADEGHVFGSWMVVSGGVQLSGNPATFTMPAGDVSVKAEFITGDGSAHSITLSDDGNGTATATIGDMPVTEAEEGATVTLTATPGEGYLFDKWTAESEGVAFADATLPSTTFVMPAANVSVRAGFKAIPAEKYAITMTDDGNGTAVAKANNVEISEAEAGATITIIATPADGYMFDGWTTESEDVVFANSSLGITTFVMPARAVEITAGFAVIEEDIDVFTKMNDDLFREYCVQFDINSDGILTIPEAEMVISMDASYIGVASLEGIEYFKNLQVLNLMYNSLTELDMSQNKALSDLILTQNQLTSLNVSGLMSLAKLSCNNNKLASLDVSGLTKLTELYVSNNMLTSLNVSGCTATTYINCYRNKLSSLDVSGLTALTDLSCDENQLTSLILTECTSLGWLVCAYNQLYELDLTGLTSLYWLNFNNNQLSSIDLATNAGLKSIWCRRNYLNALDISNNPLIEGVSCYENRISELDITNINYEWFFAYIGNQTADGSTPQTLTLTLRADQVTNWNEYYLNNPDDNKNVTTVVVN